MVDISSVVDVCTPLVGVENSGNGDLSVLASPKSVFSIDVLLLGSTSRISSKMLSDEVVLGLTGVGPAVSISFSFASVSSFWSEAPGTSSLVNDGAKADVDDIGLIVLESSASKNSSSDGASGCGKSAVCIVEVGTVTEPEKPLVSSVEDDVVCTTFESSTSKYCSSCCG